MSLLSGSLLWVVIGACVLASAAAVLLGPRMRHGAPALVGRIGLLLLAQVLLRRARDQPADLLTGGPADLRPVPAPLG